MDSRLKAQIRLELFRCAARGDFPSYQDFYERLKGKKMKGQFPYQRHFDAIAKEERKLGYPDITFVVHRADPKNPYPSQIDFRSAKPLPDANQIKSVRLGMDQIIALYCPIGTQNPY
jgi:hypothetical protein